LQLIQRLGVVFYTKSLNQLQYGGTISIKFFLFNLIDLMQNTTESNAHQMKNTTITLQ